ncbi:hypothetical protein [Aerococcus urinaeequi]|uniref:hypothetical protein n=1 Tax=Aerococcus urinaeequi TaxID=51665 RepID=UPI003EC54A63
MKIQHNYTRGGYSEKTAEKYISNNEDILCLSENLQPQQEFIDGKPTNRIASYKAWFTQRGLPPFEVKFMTAFDLPPYLTKVTFKKLEGFEGKREVYFRAESILVQK